MNKSNILCLSLLFILPLTISGNPRVHGANSTAIKVLPSTIEVKEGQNFTVSIYVQDVVNMQSFQFKISWDTEFVDYISHTVTPPWPSPPPIIILDPVENETEGYIMIGAISSGATFTGSGTLAAIVFEALKSGTTQIAFSAVIIEPTQLIVTEDAVVTILPSSTCLKAAGTVSLYGSNDASGLVNIFAIVDNWADVCSIFTVPPLGPIILIYPPPPLPFTLYLVRIVNASEVKLNYGAADLWISGFWGVSNVTNPSSMKDIIALIQNIRIAAGELSVTGNWMSFTINIEGFESIQGNMTSHYVRKIDNAVAKFPRYDFNWDCKIDMGDVVICCSAFGSSIGLNKYELNVDTNFDLRIDMGDIIECLQYFGKNA